MTPATPEQLRILRGIVYGILNRRNGRWYIGQTKHTFRRRYSGGRWWDKTTSPPLRNAYKRYGPEAFEIYVFEAAVADEQRRFDLEDEYVRRYNAVFPAGYCFQSGGQQYGKRVSTASRAKMSMSALRWKAKHHVLLDATETEHRFTNIVTFARERGLNPKQVSNLLRGVCARYGGYHRPGVCLAKFYQASELKTVVDPNGREHSFYNAAEFCRQHGLCDSSLTKVLNRQAKQYKGWQLKTDDVKPVGYRWKNEGNSHKRYARIVLERGGRRYTITNDIRQFCEEHGLQPREIYTLTRGDQRTTHGFGLVGVEYTASYLAKHPELITL